MSAVPQLADKKSLRALVPLNGLSNAHFEELSKKATILELKAGKYLFKKGERDNSTCYVLSGEIALIDGTDIKLTIQGGTEEAKHPIAPQQPRQLSARAKTKTTIISIDSGLLDVMLAWEQSSSYETAEVEIDEDEDWMSRLMQSELLQQLPATNLQQLFMRMGEVSVKAGDVIVKQDDDGDYYYIIKTGTCVVSRRPSAKAKEVKLAELSDGASFGEESLLSGAKRNATVTMLTDGQLMRLSKKDFNELLKAPLLSEVTYREAKHAQQDGAIYLDVRLPGEFSNAHLNDSINIPLAAIRSEITNIDKDATYIVYCDTGRRSSSAVFLLGQFGIEAHVLKGGLSSVPIEEYNTQEAASPSPAETTDSAEVIDIHRDKEQAKTDAAEPALASAAAIDALNKEISALTAKLEVAEKQIVDQAKNESMESEMLAQAQEMDAEISGLKESLKQAQQESGKKAAQLEQTEKAAARQLKLQTDKLKKVEKELKSVTTLGKDADDLKEQNLALQLEKKQFNEDLKAEKEKREILDKKSKELDDQLAKIRGELKNSEQVQGRSEAELTQARALLDKSEKTVEQHKTEMDELAGKVKELENEKLARDKDADSSLSELNAALDKLRKDNSGIEKSLEAEKKLATTLQQQVDVQLKKEKALTSDFDKLKAELEKEKANEKNLLAEKDKLSTELAQARNEFKVELEKQKKQSDQIQGDVEGTKNEKLKLEQELAASNEKLKLLEEEIKQQAKITDEARAETTNVSDELSLGREKIKSLEDRLEQENNKTQAVSDELHQSDEKIKALESELEQQQSVQQQSLQKEKETADRLQNQINAYEEKSKAAKSAYSEIEQKNKDLETLIESLKDSNVSAEKASADKLQTAEIELEKVTGEKLEFERNLTKAESNIGSVRQELESVQAERQKLEQQSGALNAELLELKELAAAAGNDTEAQIAALQRQLGEVASVKYTLTEELESAKATASELAKKNKELESSQHESQSGLQEQTEGLQVKLAESKESLELAQQQLAEKSRETSEVSKELEALKTVYAQKELDVTRLQNDLGSINLKVNDYRQKDDDEQLEKRKIEEDLRLTRKELELSNRENSEKIKALQNELELKSKAAEEAMSRADKVLTEHSDADVAFAQSDRESSERIQAMEKELKEKSSAIKEVMRRADEAESLKSDAESAFQLLEQEVDELRQQDDDYRKALGAAREELAQVKLDRQKFSDQIENSSPQVDRDFAQSRIKELEALVKDGQSGMADARNRVEKLEHELSIQKHNSDMDNNLQGQIEKLKKEMEVQLNQYKSEIDNEALDLQKENEGLREELKEYFEVKNEQVDTGTIAKAKKAKSPPSSQDDMVDASALFDLPDIDRNLFNNSVQQEPAKTSLLMVASIAFLFSILSAGAVYWYFVLRVDSGVPKPVVVTEKKKVATAVAPKVKPVVKVKQKVATKKKSTKPLFNFASKSDESAKPAKKAVSGGKLSATREFRDRLASGGRGPTMIGVPAGSFVMGSPSSSVHFDERPSHAVSMAAFSLSRHEVTFSQYDKFAAATGRSRPSDNGWGRGTRPVVNVTWSDATAYAAWLSKETGRVYRLPSEAQWEYAARAGTTSKYWWGPRAMKNKANCFNCGSKWDRVSTAPVGSFDTNSLGLHDMLGNAMEWVADCYHGNFNGAPVDGSVWTEKSCGSYVARGGAYLSTSENIRISKRSEFKKDISLDQLGFRVVRVK